jgi:hypothetical protein
MILNETVAAIADAIREKTGKSELIAPIDFASEIKGITAGGGSGESGGSNVEYLDVSGLPAEERINTLFFSELIKKRVGTIHIAPPLTIMVLEGVANEILGEQVEAIALPDISQYPEEYKSQIDELITRYPRLTKEEFYDLNA